VRRRLRQLARDAGINANGLQSMQRPMRASKQVGNLRTVPHGQAENIGADSAHGASQAARMLHLFSITALFARVFPGPFALLE
jgi:hypothetical protein